MDFQELTEEQIEEMTRCGCRGCVTGEGGCDYESPEYLAYMERMEREHELDTKFGPACPKCEARRAQGYTERSVRTRNYGGGWDTIYNCKRCGFQDVAV